MRWGNGTVTHAAYASLTFPPFPTSLSSLTYDSLILIVTLSDEPHELLETSYLGKDLNIVSLVTLYDLNIILISYQLPMTIIYTFVPSYSL